MTIENIIVNRNIEEILHFTTNKGITGILATNALKSRISLPKETHLEYIYQYNCEDRSRDKPFWDYVNLSITTVNRHLFGISAGKWHSEEEGWWCILSFDPIICTHNDVLFTSTNNMYSGVVRNGGALGLESLFQKNIIRWNGNRITRDKNALDAQPTCEQAELLYPSHVSLDYLRTIYVANDDDASALESIVNILKFKKDFNILVLPSMFSN